MRRNARLERENQALEEAERLVPHATAIHDYEWLLVTEQFALKVMLNRYLDLVGEKSEDDAALHYLWRHTRQIRQLLERHHAHLSSIHEIPRA